MRSSTEINCSALAEAFISYSESIIRKVLLAKLELFHFKHSPSEPLKLFVRLLLIGDTVTPLSLFLIQNRLNMYGHTITHEATANHVSLAHLEVG